MSRKEKLLNKLLNYYPQFLTRLPGTAQHSFVKTIRNELLPVYTTLKILDLQENLDRPLLIWKEQNCAGTYDMHFQVLLDNLETVEIYKENTDGTFKLEVSETFTSESETNQYYHIIKDISTENNEIIPSTRYYLHVTTFDEYEFYKGFPENDINSSDYLDIVETENSDGTYRLDFNVNGLNNIYKVEIDTYVPNRETRTYYNSSKNITDIDERISFKNKLVYKSTVTCSIYDNWGDPNVETSEWNTNLKSDFNYRINKILDHVITKNKYVFKVYTCNNIEDLEKGVDTGKVYTLTLTRNHIETDMYDHDYSLDIIGHRLNFPRSKLNPYDGEQKNYYDKKTNNSNLIDVNSPNADLELYKCLKFYEKSEPAFNNRYTEDDYHYSERMKFYVENLQPSIRDTTIGKSSLEYVPHRKDNKIIAPLELPQLEIYKHWGIVPELVNRDKYLVKQNKDYMRGLLCGDGDEGLKMDTSIYLENSSRFTVGVDGKLIARVKVDETNELVNRGKVVFRITWNDGVVSEPIVTSISNYRAVVSFTPRKAGVNSVSLKYQGSGKYKRSTGTGEFLVNAVPTKIYADNIRILPGEDPILRAHVISTRNREDEITGVIEFTLRELDKNKYTTVINEPLDDLRFFYHNEALYHYFNLQDNDDVNLKNKNVYHVKARYLGEGDFASSETEFTITVSEVAEKCFIHSFFVPNKHISCKLFGENNYPIDGATIRLRYKGITLDKITTKAKAYIPFSKRGHVPENLGDLELIFDGDDKYLATTYQVPPFEDIVPEATQIELLLGEHIVVNGNNTLQCQLKSNSGTPLTEQTIKWYMGTEFIGESVTDYDGITLINYTPTIKGVYDLTCEYEGEALIYEPCTSSQSVEVVDSVNTSININTTSIPRNENLIINLTDENNLPVAYQTITILNGVNNTEFASVTTDYNGVASLQFTMTARSNQKIIFQFDGDEQGYYNPSTLTVEDFNVTRRPLNMMTTPAPGSSLNRNETMEIRTRLLDGITMAPVEGLSVAYHFLRVKDGASERRPSTGYLTTDSNGEVSYPLAYGAGEYKYGVIVETNDLYNGKDTWNTNDGAYRTPFTITDTTGNNTLKSFKVHVSPTEITRGDEYTVSVELTGNVNIAPTGTGVVYIGTNNNGTLTGIQSEIKITDNGNGKGIGSVTLQSSSTMNPTKDIGLKVYYKGNSEFIATDSSGFEDGIAYIDVNSESDSSTLKKDISLFTVEVPSSSSTIKAGDDYMLNVRLFGTNNLVPTGQLKIYTQSNFTGYQGTVDLTESDGLAVFNGLLSSSENAKPNTYNLYAYYTGDDNFNPVGSWNFSTGKGTLTVTSSTSGGSASSGSSSTILSDPGLSLKSNPTSIQENSQYELQAVLSSNDATGSVTFYQSGKLLGEVTVTNGIAVLPLNSGLVNPNNGSFTATYNGDNKYKSTSVTKTFTMVKSSKDTSLSVASGGSITKGGYFKVKLSDEDNNPVGGCTVKVVFTRQSNGVRDNKVLSAVTDYTGLASVGVNYGISDGELLTADVYFDGATVNGVVYNSSNLNVNDIVYNNP